ncbi:uncharacterized protein RSE6_10136 [Rhynchosporium secalis]|uniref:Uncharacterized protein n=1 Tax=Rhynchosporium secalis TaxID=38038 RepID=A0A1E1MJR8_RHYSE|nr:uncharacterized protein RSE6_10136 [Rhynchosporium secalis]
MYHRTITDACSKTLEWIYQDSTWSQRKASEPIRVGRGTLAAYPGSLVLLWKT